MKLRNKKTGEIKDFGNLQVYAEAENTDESQLLGNFDSFKQILEYYEDYIPKEPLIKDEFFPNRAEKARKTLKLWADTNGFKKVSYHVDSYVSVFYNECNPAECATQIEFGWIMEGLKPGTYGIAELCGEEE